MLSRIVQIVWMVVAAVCVYEAYFNFTNVEGNQVRGYFFVFIALLAITRYFMLRRLQYRKKKEELERKSSEEQ